VPVDEITAGSHAQIIGQEDHFAENPGFTEIQQPLHLPSEGLDTFHESTSDTIVPTLDLNE
jgi:hypothetical protein